jgi:hypothetical protein
MATVNMKAVNNEENFLCFEKKQHIEPGDESLDRHLMLRVNTTTPTPAIHVANARGDIREISGFYFALFFTLNFALIAARRERRSGGFPRVGIFPAPKRSTTLIDLYKSC